MSDSPKTDFIREIIAADLASGKHETTITRFPPEPNGYLHLGHARAICLNFGIAQENAAVGARCHLRFDDTNPEKEEVEYVESIKADVKWLGFDWGDNLFYASDYFEFYYDCAVHLIKNGLAYVDEQTAEQIKETRGNLTVPGTPSPWRDRSVEENLELFAKMRAGGFEEGAAVLRAKIDMASPNIVLRDPVIYRVLKAEHHNTGDAWCLYPMYDFAHPLEDAHEHITHSLCTLEFEIHRPFYDWVIENCPVPAKPRQIEFSRLNFTYTVMSKRKLLTLVKEGHVAGWDDPRMPTLSGARRRGIPAIAIRKLCEKTGITKFQGITDIAQLEFEIRDHLNAAAPRRMGVIDPLKLIIENFPAGQSEDIELDNHPKDPAMGSRQVALSRELWIEADDFMEVPEKKYFRLGPGRHVRLRGGYIVKCTGFEKDASGKITEVRCEYLPGTRGADAPEGVECRAAIHWVSAEHGVEAEVRLYDRLFTAEDPDAAEGGFVSVINPDSLKTIRAYVEPAAANAAPEEVYQFERLGYFVADRHDHQPGTKPVFNRTIGLRDSWAKK
ncbi:glutamine--tRNA ligase/YqeY domain fusion protein [Luteolibacter luteus]|uniref:Glutamine--tRNA ligase n=1 Tax=Luteolibacter luteus TaxID=2728835 RepID=A0A858RLN8_9BACT|nr:glutamine--tRNA ligase/YqeY domain fusion protein [Luteolibacter luteus]QJE97378.1 glutamine--tRNA ligase/YqeY domain fusion protein [Luteolibacter luteus]